jgi:hypothetical protein
MIMLEHQTCDALIWAHRFEHSHTFSGKSVNISALSNKSQCSSKYHHLQHSLKQQQLWLVSICSYNNNNLLAMIATHEFGISSDSAFHFSKFLTPVKIGRSNNIPHNLQAPITRPNR